MVKLNKMVEEIDVKKLKKRVVDYGKEKIDAILNVLSNRTKFNKHELLKALFEIYIQERSHSFQSFIAPAKEIITDNKYIDTGYKKLIKKFDDYALKGTMPSNTLESVFEDFIRFFQNSFKTFKQEKQINQSNINLLLTIIEEYETPREIILKENEIIQNKKITEFSESLLSNNTDKELEANQDIIIKVFQLFHDEEFWNYYWVNASIRKKAKEEIELQIKENYKKAHQNGLLADNDISSLPEDVQKFLFITEKMKPIYKELETELGMNIDIDEIISAIDVAFMLNVNKTEDAKIKLEISKNYKICPYLLMKLFYMRRDYKTLGRFMQNAIYYDNFSGKLEDIKLQSKFEQKYKCDLIYDYDNAYIKLYSNTSAKNVKDFLDENFKEIHTKLQQETHTFGRTVESIDGTEYNTNNIQYYGGDKRKKFYETMQVVSYRLQGLTYEQIADILDPNSLDDAMLDNIKKNHSNLTKTFKINLAKELSLQSE